MGSSKKSPDIIAVIDYGMGNLRSVQKALEQSGAQAVITQKAEEINKAAKVVLPGVGAMQPAVEKLRSLGLIETIKQTVITGKPFLGICLGLQLLFEQGFEGGNVEGLGIFEGTVQRFPEKLTPHLKIPHMGWNQIKFQKANCPLFKNLSDQVNVYFCHSYFVNPKNKNLTAASTDYGITFTSSVWKDNVFGVQFHPEKSQEAGLKILKNFVELKI